MSWSLESEGFVLREPLRYRPWYNFLSNGDYGLKLSHLGDGYASTLTEPRVVVTNYDSFTPNRGRFLYIRDEQLESAEKVWNPGLYPSGNPVDSYRCTHAPGYVEISGEKGGIQATSTHFLPPSGTWEIWVVKITNNSDRRRRVSVFNLAEFLLYDSMSVDPVYFSWFTNSRYIKDSRRLEFFRTDSKPVYGFFQSSLAPDGYEASLVEFQGEGDYRDPESPRNGALGNNNSAGDPYIGSFQYNLDLKAGESREWVMVLGQGEQSPAEAENLCPDANAALALLADEKRRWKNKLHRDEWAKIVDPQFKAYAESFFPYQIIQQSTGMVRSTFRGYRDVAQDAMGLSFFDPDAAGQLIRDLCSKMMSSGRCLRQWNTGGGFNDERDFRDLPLWLPLAVERYLDQRDDPGFLSEQAPFFNSDETATVLEHIIRGLEYVLQYGPHDLIKMGVGDWNDALSGLGTEGESLWLNQMAYYALGILKKIVKKYSLSCSLDIRGHMDRLYNGVMRGWTGKWFLRGYTNEGVAVGAEERIFLLPQAWFTISGMAQHAPDKAATALDSMVERLRNDNGLLICHPGFDSFDPLVGNLSCLAPGVAENFAVYNHASAFGVYSLLQAGRTEEGLEFLKKLLPFNADPAKSKAEPFVLVNYYNGGYYPNKAGQGGVPWLTGTVHWLALSLFDHIFPGGIEL